MTLLTARVGSVTLPNPVMTASGTSGHGTELSAYGDLREIGAVVVKSLAAFPWEGNPPLRVVPARSGMLNSVGLTGPGVEKWCEGHLGSLEASGARTVVSIWGRKVDEYAAAAKLLAERELPASVVAVEVNVSCPNTEDRARMFAQSASATGEVIGAVTTALHDRIRRPVWAKLTPSVSDIVEIAAAALAAGAESLTLVNTMPAMGVDIEKRKPELGGITGGMSGPALHPIALRCVYECRAAFPEAAIVGVGGVFSAEDAVALMMAGADAVQVGTATFADPRAPWKLVASLDRWCRRRGIAEVAEIVGAAQ